MKDVSVTEQDLHTILETLKDERAKNEALKKRVAFLESVLEQRIVLTQKNYNERREKFNQMQELVFKLFLANPGIPFTYVELEKLWEDSYPNLQNSKINVGRRVRELVQLKKVWQNLRSDGIAQFWLKLDENKPEP